MWDSAQLRSGFLLEICTKLYSPASASAQRISLHCYLFVLVALFRYTANDAKDIGLVQSVLPDQDLMPHVKTIAQTIASRAPLAVRASKKAITQGLRQSFEDAAAQEVADFAKLFLTKDAQEGCDAFVNKREAEWTGA